MSIVIAGSVAFDEIETPYGKSGKIVGGAGTYIGLAASLFNVDVKMVSTVGGDFPKEILTMLENRNIDTAGIQIKESEKSFFWRGRYHTNMNKRDTLETQLNVLADFNPKLPDSYKKADYLMLGNLLPQVQMQVLEQMESKPKLVAMDTMNFWMDSAMDSLEAVLKKVDLLIINDEEARQLSEEYSLIKAAKKIKTFGPKYLIIKKGENGALLFYNDNIFFAPAILLEEVFDPTGAGDTFAGSFIGHIAKKDDIGFDTMKQAVMYGSACASFCVEAFGIKSLQSITPQLLQQRTAQLAAIMNVNL